MERLTKRSNKTVHENGVCCTHFRGKECSERMGECTDNCPWEEAAWSKLADYEDIGTVSEFRELKEKATAKFLPCPKCGSVRSLGDGFCYDCGTALDWSEGKE